MTAEQPLSQNEIGRRLGLSSATMSKLRAHGCPMDSLEAVRTWREQGLLPKSEISGKKADTVIRDHPYESIGIAFGLGLLIGVLVRRK